MSSIVIKIFTCDGTGAVRRRKFDTSAVTLAQVQEVAHLQSNARLTWRDEDNDIIQIETQADLQEAILSSVAQNSSLRLFVDHATPSSAPTASSSAPTASSSAPTASSSTPTDPSASDLIRSQAQGFKALLRASGGELLSSIHRAWSAFKSSGTIQAVKEDVCSIRGVFEARVERTKTKSLPIIKFATLAALLWTLFFPTFWNLCSIGIGAALMPRNALKHKTCKQVRVLFGLLCVRVALTWMFGCVLTPFLFIGFTFCIMTKMFLGLAFCLCLFKRCGRGKRNLRKGRHRHCRQSRTSEQQQQPQQRQWQQEIEEADIFELRKIFPDMQLAYLRQKYSVHKNLQQTVAELLE